MTYSHAEVLDAQAKARKPYADKILELKAQIHNLNLRVNGLELIVSTQRQIIDNLNAELHREES